jgi:hypothetical protein
MGTALPAEQQEPQGRNTETHMTHCSVQEKGNTGQRLVQEAQKRRTEEHNRRTQGKEGKTHAETKTQGLDATVSQHSKGGKHPKRRARPQLPVESMKSQGGTGNSEDHSPKASGCEGTSLPTTT